MTLIIKQEKQITWLEKNSSQLFYSFIILHLSIWTLLPTFLNANLPLDAIEAVAWGHEWQWGYFKHPPMSAWLAELFGLISNHADWGLYLLSQLCIITAIWAMWSLARDMLSPAKALLSALLLEGIVYHTFTSPEFNVNISLLTFWALTILTFWQAISRQSLKSWILCGLFAGLGFLSKYLIAFLLIPLLVYLVIEKNRRIEFKRLGIYVAAGTFTVIALPHFIWVLNNEWITFSYGLHRADPSTSFDWINHLLNPGRFLLSQLLMLTLPLIYLFSLSKPQWNHSEKPPQQTRFLIFAFLGPFILYFTLSMITGIKIRTMWGTPLFIMSGLVLTYFFVPSLKHCNLRRFAKMWSIGLILIPFLYGLIYIIQPSIKQKGKRTHFPGQQLAEIITREWHQKFSSKLPLVVGDEWMGGNIGWYSSDRPSIFLDADEKHAPWTSDSDIRNKGGVIIWKTGSSSDDKNQQFQPSMLEYEKRFGTVEEQPPITLNWNTSEAIPSLLIGWAIIPPPGQNQ